jgi:hypothetical protein
MRKSFLSILIIAFLFVSCIKISFELKESIPSETENKIAYIYTSATGATTGYATRVTISEKKDFNQINKEQYFLICDTDHGAVKNFEIKVEWIDDNTILVSYKTGTRFFTKKQKFNGIKIMYNEIAE